MAVAAQPPQLIFMGFQWPPQLCLTRNCWAQICLATFLTGNCRIASDPVPCALADVIFLHEASAWHMLPVLCQIARWSKGSGSLVYLAATGNMPPVLMEALLCRTHRCGIRNPFVELTPAALASECRPWHAAMFYRPRQAISQDQAMSQDRLL